MTIQARVRGMTCQGCEEVVEQAVGLLDAVDAVEANRYDNQVTVEGDVSAEDVADKIDLAGYRVESTGTAPTEPEESADEGAEDTIDADLPDEGADDASEAGDSDGSFETAPGDVVEQDDVAEEIEELAEELEE